MRKLFGVILFLLVFNPGIKAQYFSTGQDPASTNWKQINTENFRLIFPLEFEKKAHYLANILETVYPWETKSLKAKPRKISVILHTMTSYSNAYVAWAPKRTEFYTTPPQDAYPQPWLQQLALHEFRHVVQITTVRQGLTKAISYILGQQGTVGVIGLYVPFWFLEGDAVSVETAFSRAGRGRSPEFIRPLRTQILEKGLYNYNKAVFGSYRDFVPDHYVLGYHLVANGRRKFGADMWNHLLAKVGRRPYSITPFNQGIKDISGLNKTAFYRNTLDYLKQAWKHQNPDSDSAMLQWIRIHESKDYVNFLFPSFSEEDNLPAIALKSGMDDITRIVSIDSAGREEQIFTPGFILPDALAYRKGKLAWVERTLDPRWDNRNYTVLKVYDMHTGKLRQLSKRSHLFAPDFSCHGEKLLAVKTTPESKYSIVILSTETGEFLQEITTPENYFFQTPVWGDTDDEIVSVVLGDRGKKIILINPETNEIRDIYPWTYEEISGAAICHDTVYFTGSRSGISNFYAFSLSEPDKVYKITDSKYGNIDLNFSPDGQTLLYSEYTADGYRIVQREKNTAEWTRLDEVRNNGPKLYMHLGEDPEKILSDSIIPDNKYAIENYSRLHNLFNFHSWAPFYIDANNYSFNPGAVIMSQNLLSTAFTTAAYEYDLNEETGRYSLNFSYHGWYPVVDLQFSHGKRRTMVYNDSLEKQQELGWLETRIKGGFYLPLNLTNGKYRFGLRPSVYLNQRFLNTDKSAETTIHYTDLKTLDYRLYAYRTLKTSRRDIFPAWGQILVLNFRNAPFENDITDYILSGEGYLYFPGLMKHHGLRLYLGAQKTLRNRYIFSNIISNPREYHGISASELYSFKADYAIPLAYPDLSLGSIIYLKRIKSKLFYDYAIAETKDQINYFNSAGIELTADMHVFRFISPIEIGVRSSYLIRKEELKFELLFGVNFTALY